MENKKTIRNPFPWIGKIFKYEMKHTVRILLPVYIATIIIALITGLTISVGSEGNLNFPESTGVYESTHSGISGFFFFLYMVICVTSAVVSISVISKRFKNGLLGDEAYLNLTLPVTMGEHLWGRIAANLVWIICYIVTIVISLVMLYIKNLKVININEPLISNFIILFLTITMVAMSLIMFIYLINAIGHLSKKHRTMVKLLAIIIIITITSRLTGSIDIMYFRQDEDPIGVFYIWLLISLCFSVIFGLVTHFIMKLKLNLE